MYTPSDKIDDRFEIVGEIGRGGMGVVLRVHDATDGQQVALKYCPENDTNSLRRFAREVCFVANLHHKNVMPILHHNLDHDPPYFTMPIAATSVGQEIRQSALEEDEALGAFEQICLGVQAIHNINGTHRDIKPDNAMRMQDGTILVSDLGLVKLDPRDTTLLTRAGEFIGTHMYSAPEQYGGSREADVRTDIYQLGKTLYEMVTGQSPAPMDTDKLPAGLAYIIERATQQHPDQRYQSVGALMDAVRDYVRSNMPDASPYHAFEAALQAADTLLQAGQYKRENLETLLSVLANIGDDPEALLEQFDRIPRALLSAMAKDLSTELRPVLKAYADAVDSVVHGYNFSYAETVAQKMKVIFGESHDSYIKALAIRAALIASVDLNRFAAMETFASLLMAVELGQDAVAVAGMLRDEISRYGRLADDIPGFRLHPVIRAVWGEPSSE